jgi:hypothetical protein
MTARPSAARAACRQRPDAHALLASTLFGAWWLEGSSRSASLAGRSSKAAAPGPAENAPAQHSRERAAVDDHPFAAGDTLLTLATRVAVARTPSSPGGCDPRANHREPAPRVNELPVRCRARAHEFRHPCRRLRRSTHGYGRVGVYLVSAPGTGPSEWFVNEPVTYRKCAACSARVVASGQSRMDREWTPARAWYHTGRRGRLTETNPGPHPAGTYACKDCRQGEQEPF